MRGKAVLYVSTQDNRLEKIQALYVNQVIDITECLDTTSYPRLTRAGIGGVLAKRMGNVNQVFHVLFPKQDGEELADTKKRFHMHSVGSILSSGFENFIFVSNESADFECFNVRNEVPDFRVFYAQVLPDLSEYL